MKKKILAFLITILFCLVYSQIVFGEDFPGQESSEVVIFDEPQQAVSGVTSFKPMLITLDRSVPSITIVLRENLSGATDFSGRTITVGYQDQEALDLMTIINTKDFSGENDSFNKSILQKLLADGKIPPGTIEED